MTTDDTQSPRNFGTRLHSNHISPLPCGTCLRISGKDGLSGIFPQKFHIQICINTINAGGKTNPRLPDMTNRQSFSKGAFRKRQQTKFPVPELCEDLYYNRRAWDITRVFAKNIEKIFYNPTAKHEIIQNFN